MQIFLSFYWWTLHITFFVSPELVVQETRLCNHYFCLCMCVYVGVYVCDILVKSFEKMVSDEKFKSNHNQTWVIVAPCDLSFIGGVQGHRYAPRSPRVI